MIEGILAALWCAGLFYAGDVFGGATHPVDRLRNAIVLGIATPGVLGIAGVLYPATLWASLVALCVARFVRVREAPARIESGLLATFGACLVVIWPPLCRPVLDGDSLDYHVPNAMAWLQSHSLWATRAPYWYYPGGSELFASGLIGAAGRWTLPIAGAAVMLLLAGRLYASARAHGAPAYASVALALAFVCMPLAAFQTGAQNDLWIAAFFVEALVVVSPVALGALALIKPFGIVEVTIASITTRPAWRTLVIALVPFAVWIARTLILVHGGGAIASNPPYWESTIAGNLGAASHAFGEVFLRIAPASILWLLFLAAGLWTGETRRYALAGVASAVLWIFLPLSFGNATEPYFTNGSSLRFALPAFACGALVAALWASRLPRLAAFFFTTVAAVEMYAVLTVYWNDAYTRYAPWVALAFVLIALMPRIVRRPAGVAAIVLVLAIAGFCAQSRALGFYGDWMPLPSGAPTRVFSWLAEQQPKRIIAQDVRTGAVLLISPSTETTDLPDTQDGCAVARVARALLLVGTNEQSFTDAALRLSHARACGMIRYQDGAAVIVEPSRL